MNYNGRAYSKLKGTHYYYKDEGVREHTGGCTSHDPPDLESSKLAMKCKCGIRVSVTSLGCNPFKPAPFNEK